MKLLSTCLVALLLHFPFYGMVAIRDHSLEDMPSAGSSCGSDGGSKGTMKCNNQPGSCNRPPYKTTMTGENGSNYNSRLKATKIAYDSAEVAKAANEAQAAAAHDASRKVKLLLADKAMAAARAADSVVEGKQAIVDNLAREIREAEKAVGQIKASLETSRANVAAATAAAKLADNNVAALQALVDQIKSSLADLDALSAQSNADLEEKNQMVAMAKERGARLAKQFAQAKSEYEKVKNAACRAVSAAVEAKEKAFESKPASQGRPAPGPGNGCGTGPDGC